MMPGKKPTPIPCTVFFGITLLVVCVAPCAAQSSQAQSIPPIEQAAALLAEGASALERNDLTAAKSLFARALEANPKNATAHTYMGIISDRAGDLAGAEQHFAAAAAADPQSASSHNNHGASLLKLGRTREAAQEFVKSLQIDGNQANASINLAQIRLSSGTPNDLREALKLFERAYALDTDLETARALVVVSLRLNDKEAASRNFKIYSDCLSLATSRSTAAAARAELGGALIEAGLFREAITELTAAVNAEPSNATAVLRLARANLALNDIPSAGRTLESAVSRGLETAAIYALLAQVYEKSGHIENAIPAMRLAIQHDPQSEKYRFAYGILLIDALAPEAAVIRLKEATELFPNSAHLTLALGLAHFKAGRNDEAARLFRRAIELEPKFSTAFAYLGMTYLEIGQYEDAVKAYEQALVFNENSGVVDYLIADAYLRHGSGDSALVEEHLIRAVKLDPSFAPARLALGKLYFRSNRLTEAVPELQKAISIDSNLAEAYYQLGRLYARLKRTSEAEAMLASFKRLSDSQKEQEQKDRKEIVRRLADVLF